MYAPFFGLEREPFSIAPDPHYLFMSERHREALAHLLYGLRGGGGFVLLTGEIGAGKTTVCRCFLEQIPVNCNVAYIFNPKLTVLELLRTVCEEFHVAAPESDSVKAHVDVINAHLLRCHAEGRNNVLIIDEAQNLAPEVLEQLRLLTNLETHERKLLQIILIGQPELRQMLARPELEQLAQRVIARFHLDALSAAETASYVQHRLNVGGLKGPAPFDAAVLRQVHRLTGGVPRRINLLCDRALLGAYSQGHKQVQASTLVKAAAEVFDDAAQKRPWFLVAGLSALALAMAGTLATGWTALNRKPTQAPVPVATPASNPASNPTSAPASAAMAELIAHPVDEAAALSDLAALWQAQGADCAALGEGGLRCLHSEAGLSSLRFLDRPALLRIGSGWVVLERLSGQEAVLRQGGQQQTVSLTRLSQAWQGEFMTLWRAPPEDSGHPGRASPGWLAQQLGKLDGSVLDPLKEVELHRRIAAFQRAQGLPSDGIAGPVTLMQLARATGASDEPRLLK
ncbi:MAG: AAA family ATPase [Paucibacter sp.]|nr:AAA family ATPase [Roseateles sp.]